MRHEGVIQYWNSYRGCGFIRPTQGGQDLFVHISAIPTAMEKLDVGVAVSFEIATLAKDKVHAVRIQPID